VSPNGSRKIRVRNMNYILEGGGLTTSQQNSAQKNYTDQFNGTSETSKILNQINNTL